MCRLAAPNPASTRMTRLPSVASKIPTFAATRLLPTPPLPPPMATTRGIIERAHNRDPPRAVKRRRPPYSPRGDLQPAASAGRRRRRGRGRGGGRGGGGGGGG